MSSLVRAAVVDWDNSGGSNDFNAATNWVGNSFPGGGDEAHVNLEGGNRAIVSSASTNFKSLRLGTNGSGELEIVGGGVLSATTSGTFSRIGHGTGNVGSLTQEGGEAFFGHTLQIGIGGNGTYRLNGGEVNIARGYFGIGEGGGTGEIIVAGGSLVTRTGVVLDDEGTFTVEGSGASVIGIGSEGNLDGYWSQKTGGRFKVVIDAVGVAMVFVDDSDGDGTGGDVTFENGALLEVGFLDGLDLAGTWDVMNWEGVVTDGGLSFAPGVDAAKWSFSFVDTDGFGGVDTLRVTSASGSSQLTSNGTPYFWLDLYYEDLVVAADYEAADVSDTDGDGLLAWQEYQAGSDPTMVPTANGVWINDDTAEVSWSDPANWQDGDIAYGAGKVATFELNHLVAKTVDLAADVILGELTYRDNGTVNRDMSLSSKNSSRLIMAGAGGVPRIWAKNRNLHLDVQISGVDGLELKADQSDFGVNVLRRNSYSGTTTILPGNGRVRTIFPGDFGDSDLVVSGMLRIDHGRVLKTSASLAVESGSVVELDFVTAVPGEADYADLKISGLTLGGVVQGVGVYSAATHPAFFSGAGEVVVGPPEEDFKMSVQAETSVSWSSESGMRYQVEASSDLEDWTVLGSVAGTPPTNSYEADVAVGEAGFYRVRKTPDYLTAVRAGVVARIDQLITDTYLVDRNTTPGDIRHGQFHNSDNMRQSECTPVLVWAYMQPDSAHFENPDVLDAAIWSIDYMCRAQGSNGGFNEFHGWCGVPVRTNGKSSVVGFTLHGLGNAIALMAGLPEMGVRLLELMDPNGTGTNTTLRVVAWKTMLENAMPFQFSGSGRGHAPNQDLCALMGVYAVNEAYAALDGGTLLKTQAEIDALANEIYYGNPTAASDRPNGEWFSSTGMIAEFGHGDYGYDANYGIDVGYRYLGVLSGRDTTSAAFFAAKYADAFQYFFVPDGAAPLGVFAENAISRRGDGVPTEPKMPAIALASAYHPSAARLYDIMLPHFASAPASLMTFKSPHQFQIGVWSYCEWLDTLADREYVSYELPAEQSEAWQFRDDTMKLLVSKPVDGVPTYYAEIWDNAGKGIIHRYGEEAEVIDVLGVFP
ncbi:MAG: hypothetical protein ACSHYF_15820 [Verrucomicrobiaceae bacterium]